MFVLPLINKLKRQLSTEMGKLLRESVAKIIAPIPRRPLMHEEILTENPEYFQEVDPPP